MHNSVAFTLTRDGGLSEDGSGAAIDRLNAVDEAQFELGLAALAHGLLPTTPQSGDAMPRVATDTPTC
ncbi:MAG TPA: hypothetical protein VF086_01935 [Propionibacteriaceae bacterium]